MQKLVEEGIASKADGLEAGSSVEPTRGACLRGRGGLFLNISELERLRPDRMSREAAMMGRALPRPAEQSPERVYKEFDKLRQGRVPAAVRESPGRHESEANTGRRKNLIAHIEVRL